MSVKSQADPDEKRLQIGHLVNTFLPVTQNWIHSQIAFNTECDHSVFCQRLDDQGRFPLERVYALHPRRGIVSGIAVLLERFRARYPSRRFASLVKSLGDDVLHGHLASESWRHQSLVRATHLPIVTTFYGVDVNKLWRRAIWRRRYHMLFDTGAAFIAEGEHMAGCIARMGCSQEKIHVIRIGVDIGKIPEREDRDDSNVNVLFVGLGREKKGPLDAVEAFVRTARESPLLRLHLVGDGAYRARVESVLSKAGMRDRAVFHGFLDIDAYRRILSECDICLAPSVTARDGDTEGGAPVTVIEAQVAGLPVVGTNHCDIPNVVRHGETGLLCDERDVEALTRNLLQLTRDKDLRRGMGEKGRSLACAEHDIRRQVVKITEVYRSLVGRGKR